MKNENRGGNCFKKGDSAGSVGVGVYPETVFGRGRRGGEEKG